MAWFFIKKLLELAFEKKSFQFLWEIWIQVVVILVQLYKWVLLLVGYPANCWGQKILVKKILDL